MADRAPLPPINFSALAAALLERASTLVPQWLPGGVLRGNQYQCGDLSGGAGSSTSVNMANGKWADFASGDYGGDLVSLYAAIHGLTAGKAAVQVARECGLEDVAGVLRAAAHASQPVTRPMAAVAPATQGKAALVDDAWGVVAPVPDFAPAASFWHSHRNAPERQRVDVIDHTAQYLRDGQLYGYVVRFLTSTGGKDTLPYTWCTSARDGTSAWKWKTWAEPRPLYLPLGMGPQTGAETQTVILVEGEKKADVLHQLLHQAMPGVYLVATWPGGCKAWNKADWSWLAGASVLLWPDCDSKRIALTKADKEAAGTESLALEVAAQAKEFLAADKQPGMAAMLGIGARLRDDHGCKVQMLPIPAPGVLVDGWDCADAIHTDGWDAERVLAFFAQAYVLPKGGNVAADAVGSGGAGGGDTPRDGPAEAGEDSDAFAEYLDFICGQLRIKRHELGVNRSLIIAALRKAPLLQDVLCYNEMTDGPSTRLPWPWRSKAGPLDDSDDLRLGDWLCSTYKLRPASRAALSEAIDTVADGQRWHPIRNWLATLRHDGKPRMDKWLLHVLGCDVDTMPPKLRTFIELVGRFILLGLVNRVMVPGCKFDYAPVFEGKTGLGKSTLVKTLVGAEYFSDTHFELGQGKDGMEQFAGVWGYELSELTSLRRADSEQVKQFFSSSEDRFRGSYGKYVRAHPRQLVIFCSTNKKQYLYDTTGNRRFWPIWIDKPINIVWVKKYREQLFAEAFLAFKQGVQCYPTPEQEALYFEPEQRKRLVESSVQSRLYNLTTRMGSSESEGKFSSAITQLTNFLTIDQVVVALGNDPGKAGTLLEGQVRSWFDAFGWIYKRSGSGSRPYGWHQPALWPPKIDDDDAGEQALASKDGAPDAGASSNEGNDDEPF